MSSYRLRKHERNRWDEMTEVQLYRRLKKITKLDKLDCFILVAQERGKTELQNAGVARRQEVLGLKLAGFDSARFDLNLPEAMNIVDEYHWPVYEGVSYEPPNNIDLPKKGKPIKSTSKKRTTKKKAKVVNNERYLDI